MGSVYAGPVNKTHTVDEVVNCTSSANDVFFLDAAVFANDVFFLDAAVFALALNTQVGVLDAF